VFLGTSPMILWASYSITIPSDKFFSHNMQSFIVFDYTDISSSHTEGPLGTQQSRHLRLFNTDSRVSMVYWCFCTGVGNRPHLSYIRMIAVVHIRFLIRLLRVRRLILNDSSCNLNKSFPLYCSNMKILGHANFHTNRFNESPVRGKMLILVLSGNITAGSRFAATTGKHIKAPYFRT